MKTIKKEARENTALQVVQLVNQGVSVIGACRQVGVSRSSYYQYQKDFPEVLHTFQSELLDSTYENLLLILVGRVELLQ
jgi:ACT domain-containing protein